MAAAVAVEHLLARQADLHRPVEQHRRLGDDDLVVERIALAAEAAAVRRRDHADVRRRHLERLRERAVHVVRRLRARPEHQLAVGILQRRPPRAARSAGACCPRRRTCPRRRGRRRRAPRRRRRTAATTSLWMLPSSPYSWMRGSGCARLSSGDANVRSGSYSTSIRSSAVVGGGLVARDHRGDRIADEAHLVAAERVLVLADRQDAVRDREAPGRSAPDGRPAAPARAVSMRTMRACGCGERSSWQCSMRGSMSRRRSASGR